mmetsp:Transcript_64116/g.126838  ORF Transcript_64116/g.126838 Transcript_64116/m.126838 type:complete len:290 (+) Transcript_64116:137-1006(+)|eukprot:CAMPEP_0172684402 /NCGR_PEP_ID=MMETSP1074-20121228/19532_1 /TAXON_ID=2916 /ORGANISM="Ceratium fusus, Strain PA161109" /LENGTH=289 /DNA_ID=CAMNT_0013503407 /DNA_START=91 /DNA_END=960 /DNA_ORIENTATION=+
MRRYWHDVNCTLNDSRSACRNGGASSRMSSSSQGIAAQRVLNQFMQNASRAAAMISPSTWKDSAARMMASPPSILRTFSMKSLSDFRESAANSKAEAFLRTAARTHSGSARTHGIEVCKKRGTILKPFRSSLLRNTFRGEEMSISVVLEPRIAQALATMPALASVPALDPAALPVSVFRKARQEWPCHLPLLVAAVAAGAAAGAAFASGAASSQPPLPECTDASGASRAGCSKCAALPTLALPLSPGATPFHTGVTSADDVLKSCWSLSGRHIWLASLASGTGWPTWLA